MPIKLYLDEDAMDGDLANALHLRGIDVLTALDAGMIERQDKDHLMFATLHERTLYCWRANAPSFAFDLRKNTGGDAKHDRIPRVQVMIR